MVENGDRWNLEIGRPVFEVAARKGWPVMPVIEEVGAALDRLPESRELVEARERAEVVISYRRQVDVMEFKEARGAQMYAGRVYAPEWPWRELARASEVMEVYRRRVRPSWWFVLTGWPPVLWTRFVRDVLIARQADS